MSVFSGQSLHVTLQDLPPVFVVYISCQIQQTTGNYIEKIRDGFQRIKDWVQQHGYDPSALKVIGIPHTNDTQLVGYECALELTAAVSPNTGDISTKQLPGGRYAVLSLDKNSATIGETIGRFFTEYIPQHQLIIDSQRPIFEVYYEHTMEYCVPLQ
ncbi:GyrI-like domain-containing protein [Synechococcus sp. Nb3U1]|uniref:AraC family transcriptional regulator n=1 Tax=Synechococcus sp. Nb3U1 TaxID=1914529 RepID=UPI001F180962|nr:GyrI-like domain-containing protein [Synechococcus sp. Nb3U1]MCF2971367.1 GyrI-like domain-containing protein [Synechococcus sp. Nb3U1]